MAVRLPPFLIEKFFLSYSFQKVFFRLSVHDYRRLWDKELFLKAYAYNKKIPGKTLDKFTSDNDSGSLEDRIKDIKAPTLIVWGENDRIIPVDNAYRFFDDIEESNL
jgi:pimeloyl-ACP methyl ester carboxylesterase